MAQLPQASQTYNPLLTSGQRVVRRAVCPVHSKSSSEFVGAGEGQDGKTYWTFRCSALTTRQQKADHMFSARPDPSAPRTPDELASWVQRQLAERAQIPVGKTQN